MGMPMLVGEYRWIQWSRSSAALGRMQEEAYRFPDVALRGNRMESRQLILVQLSETSSPGWAARFSIREWEREVGREWRVDEGGGLVQWRPTWWQQQLVEALGSGEPRSQE